MVIVLVLSGIELIYLPVAAVFGFSRRSVDNNYVYSYCYK